MTYPNFSVSMCVYGGDNSWWFEQSLDSVYSQTLPPTEVVLVVDGPIPDSIERVIGQFSKNYKNLRVIRLSENKGHGIARDKCVANCKYDYIAIADSDDLNEPNRFETEMKCFLNNEELSVVGSLHSTFVEDNYEIISVSSRPEHNEDIVKNLKKMCPVTQATVMFKKDIYNKSGGYIDWYCAEDYYLWIRMFESGGVFYNCQKPLVRVRTSMNQYSRRGGWKYFKSTSLISVYMYKKGIISLWRVVANVLPRFILQVICPPNLRGKLRNAYIGRKKSCNNN